VHYVMGHYLTLTSFTVLNLQRLFVKAGKCLLLNFVSINKARLQTVLSIREKICLVIRVSIVFLVIYLLMIKNAVWFIRLRRILLCVVIVKGSRYYVNQWKSIFGMLFKCGLFLLLIILTRFVQLWIRLSASNVV
jgi:hypothetical protein